MDIKHVLHIAEQFGEAEFRRVAACWRDHFPDIGYAHCVFPATNIAERVGSITAEGLEGYLQFVAIQPFRDANKRIAHALFGVKIEQRECYTHYAFEVCGWSEEYQCCEIRIKR